MIKLVTETELAKAALESYFTGFRVISLESYNITLRQILNILATIRLPRLIINPCEDIHALLIEFFNTSRKIHEVESVLFTNLKIADFEHEPVGVASSVGVDFHEEIVLIVALKVDRVKIATFEVLVE